jgi:predicted outer membrane protein
MEKHKERDRVRCAYVNVILPALFVILMAPGFTKAAYAQENDGGMGELIARGWEQGQNVLRLGMRAIVDSLAERQTAAMAAVARAINNGEIMQAELALQMAQNREVLAFAQSMKDDHLTANVRMNSLFNVQPQENMLSRTMEGQVRAMTAALQRVPSSFFDKTYLQSQIVLHAQVLASLRLGLIPWTWDPSAKTYLLELADSVAHHLVKAVEVLNALQQ